MSKRDDAKYNGVKYEGSAQLVISRSLIGKGIYRDHGCRDAIEQASDRDSSDRWKLARKGKTRNRWNRDVVNPFTLRAGLSAPTLRISPFLRSRLHAVGPRRDHPIVRRNPTESGRGARRSSCRQVFSDREETSTFIPPR